jgi:hypothetical protein
MRSGQISLEVLAQRTHSDTDIEARRHLGSPGRSGVGRCQLSRPLGTEVVGLHAGVEKCCSDDGRVPEESLSEGAQAGRAAPFSGAGRPP